jgi:hypothetical protein
MSDFRPFAKAVHDRFLELSKSELFVVGDHATQDNLYAHYLASFPAGTNPIYIKNTEHDCSCCRNFIKNLGRVVGLSANGEYLTVWDIDTAGVDPTYVVVAEAMKSFIHSRAITDVFRTKEQSYGAEQTRQLLADKSVRNWNHFHGKIEKKHLSATPDESRGVYRTTAQVFRRGLEELQTSAIDTVIDLIAGKALYRGEEHLAALTAFRKLQSQFNETAFPENFVWKHAADPATRFRNTVIGTLVQDISSGVELEAAVRSFEAKVAPTNYKRTTALITPRMVQEAMATINNLGLESALDRRFAKLSDISVNNVLWVDNTVQSKMKDGVEGLLMAAASTKSKGVPEGTAATQISIEDFMATVVPKATGMDVLVKNAQQANFMSLTAPAQADSGKLFKWNNDFAWSYDGNITDSIKEKVKMAGGNVTSAKLRISLAWSNYDDLDLHVWDPQGSHIYFRDKQNKLDVDMNAGGGSSRTPVENVSFTSLSDGIYRVAVDQYSRRETVDFGFQIEVENNGKIQQFTHAAAASKGQHVLDIKVSNGIIVEIKATASGLVGGSASVNKWGVATEQFVKVNTLMKSPNHWDGNQVGNKHWFFILDGCKNDQATRGIYNEFLNSELDKHRKVFEVLGNKTLCPPTDDQLSGIGFSSTRGDEVLVRVTGAKSQQLFNIKF